VAKERSPLTRSEDDRRVLIAWAVACAERALPLFEEAAPGDDRPREALAGAMAFARGEMRIGVVRQLAATRRRSLTWPHTPAVSRCTC